MLFTYSVYVHTAPNGKRYVGITSKPVLERWREGNGYYRNTHFYNAIKKYGWGRITHDVISDGLTKEKACLLEIELILKYKSNNKKIWV